jgi:hypothetical protein
MEKTGEDRMSSIAQKIKEVLTRKPTATLLIPGEKTATGKVFPTIDFGKLNDIHIGDPDVGTSLDYIGGQVVGRGFETSMDENYKEKTGNGRTAKELVDDQCQIFGLDQIIKENVVDVVGYGESFIWKGSPSKIEFLTRIMPASIQSFDFDTANIELQKVNCSSRQFDVKELVRFSYNRIGKQPLGFGVLQALGMTLTQGGEQRESFAAIKAKIQTAMVKQIKDFSSPNQLWNFPEATDDKLKDYLAKVNSLAEGRRVVYNKPGASVINAVPERMRGMDLYVEKLWNTFLFALQTPVPQLFAGGQFTQASANSALGIAEVGKIDDLRRYVKRVVEQQIFAQWLIDEGLDPLKAKVRANWRLLTRPDTNVLLPIVQRSREMKDISQREWRTILSDIGLPINPEIPEELKKEQEETKKVQEQKDKDALLTRANQPVESAQVRHEQRREEGRFSQKEGE